MRRDVTLEEISDGKLYGSNDTVERCVQDCRGCCDCCKGMGDSVVLDPYDVWRLGRGLHKSADGLMAKELELSVVDGNILPHLAMTGEEESCVFLNEEGRCSVHEYRRDSAGCSRWAGIIRRTVFPIFCRSMNVPTGTAPK